MAALGRHTVTDRHMLHDVTPTDPDGAQRHNKHKPLIGGVLCVTPPAGAHPVLGIDPGKTGALALYQPDVGELQVEDVPTFRIKGKASVDHYALSRIVDAWASLNPTVYLELVGAMPGRDASGAAVRGMGAVSAFDFGRTYGLLLGICAAHFLRIELVTPATWKAALKVKGDKDVSRQRASALLPQHSGLWPLKKHDGRAEATLIALYGAQALQERAV